MRCHTTSWDLTRLLRLDPRGTVQGLTLHGHSTSTFAGVRQRTRPDKTEPLRNARRGSLWSGLVSREGFEPST